MGVTTYYSAGGELLGHRTDVGAAYGTDALGSVTVTAIDDQQRTPTNYYYKPYGSRLNKLGNNPDPKFQWVGTAGYRETAISHSKSYVQARHLGQEEGRWTTVDPLWPLEPSYGYVRSRPTRIIDPTGSIPRVDESTCPQHLGSFKDANQCISDFCKALGDPIKSKQIQKCIDDLNKYLGPKNALTIDCLLTRVCSSNLKITCGDCPEKDQVQVVCEEGRCRGKRFTKCSPCAGTTCNPPKVVIYSSTGTSYWKEQCPGDNTRPFDYCDKKNHVLIHELAHLCSNCFGDPDTHQPPFKEFASCVARIVGCKGYL